MSVSNSPSLPPAKKPHIVEHLLPRREVSHHRSKNINIKPNNIRGKVNTGRSPFQKTLFYINPPSNGKATTKMLENFGKNADTSAIFGDEWLHPHNEAVKKYTKEKIIPLRNFFRRRFTDFLSKMTPRPATVFMASATRQKGASSQITEPSMQEAVTGSVKTPRVPPMRYSPNTQYSDGPMSAQSDYSIASNPIASAYKNQLPSTKVEDTANGGAIYLDGNLVGRWLSRHLRDQASRPPVGSLSFDRRLTAMPQGMAAGW